MYSEELMDVAKTLYYAADCIRYFERVSKLPSCNDCGESNTCPYRPEWGDSVRINCPLWEKRREE